MLILGKMEKNYEKKILQNIHLKSTVHQDLRVQIYPDNLVLFLVR